MGSPRGGKVREEAKSADEMGADAQVARSDEVAASAGTQADGAADVRMESVDVAPSAEDVSLSADERKLQEHKDKLLRLAAEYDNYRKRSLRERQEAGARAQADLIRTLVDPLDDLARVAHVNPDTTDAFGVIEGVNLVEKKLLKALAAAGLETINPVDQPFNPERHEAVSTEPALSPEDDHMVSRVYQPGYVFNGQLLRPARVVVKQWNG